MIFHTAADSKYYNYFYDFYKFSIEKFYPDSKLSLHYMGKACEKIADVAYITKEDIDLSTIYEKFSPNNDKDAYGYYALSRWWSLPVIDEHVVISDVDIMAIKTLPYNIDELLIKNQVINITRTKKDLTEGGMAMIIIHKDIVQATLNHAENLLKTKKLYWALDVEVKKFLYNNFTRLELPEMHVLNKRSQIDILDHTNRSFVIRKGRINEKIATLQKVNDLFNRTNT